MSICLSVHLHVSEPRVQTSPNFLYTLPVAVSRPAVMTVPYVLPVLRMRMIVEQIQIQAIGVLFTMTHQAAPRTKSTLADCLFVLSEKLLVIFVTDIIRICRKNDNNYSTSNDVKMCCHDDICGTSDDDVQV